MVTGMGRPKGAEYETNGEKTEKGSNSTEEFSKGSRADLSGTLGIGNKGLTKIRRFEKWPNSPGPLPHSTGLGIHPLLHRDRGSGCLFSEEDKAESLSLL